MGVKTGVRVKPAGLSNQMLNLGHSTLLHLDYSRRLEVVGIGPIAQRRKVGTTLPLDTFQC